MSIGTTNENAQQPAESKKDLLIIGARYSFSIGSEINVHIIIQKATL